MWKWKEDKTFDVTTGHAQNMPSQHALNFSWGGVYTLSLNIICTYMAPLLTEIILVLQFTQCFPHPMPVTKPDHTQASLGYPVCSADRQHVIKFVCVRVYPK